MRWLLRLTEPHPTIQAADDRRKVRALLSVSLAFLVCLTVGGLMVILQVTIRPGQPVRHTLIYISPAIAAGLIGFPVYAVAKSPDYRRSVLLLVAGIAVLGFGTMLVITGAPTYAYVSVPLVGVFLASVFLDMRSTAYITLVETLILMLVMTIRVPFADLVFEVPMNVMQADIYSSLIVLFCFGGVGTAITLLGRVRELLERDRQIARDLALEKERVAEDLRRQEQVKSAFLASMSHELRTPLNSVLNFSEFVASGMLGPVNSEQVEALHNVITSGEHLLGLINDVLDMTKIESGALELFIEDVDLGAIVDNAVATAYGLIRDKDVRLVVEIEPNLPIIRGDRRRLTQILLNLLSNAIKFTPSGSVTVNVQRCGDEIRLAVCDTGLGIAANDLETIFQPFRQAEHGKKEGHGTGLGLPICRNLAEAHGGRLWAESEEGRGSTFSVAIPIKEAVAAIA
ncbi:MAG: HAMP domain-containing histidine kinase [Anaerolineae bacterium]|nr:HAMP domain-containing histidine kinase [Anaerolineae bacterium]